MMVQFALTTIMVIALQSLIVFYMLKIRNDTACLMAIFSVLIFVDAGLMLLANVVNLDNAHWSTSAPFGLVYGPLLFLFYNSTQRRRLKKARLVLHFIPALIGLLVYIILLSSIQFRNLFLQQYLILLYTSMCASWIFYPSLILANKNRTALLSFGLFKYGMVLLWVLTSYLAPLIWTSLESGIKESALTADFVVVGAMLVAIMLTYWALLKKIRQVAGLEGKVTPIGISLASRSKQSENEHVQVSTASPNLLKNIPEEYKEKIIQSVLLERYCDPNFNLKQLAEEFNLSQSVTSQYFSQIYPDGFVKTVNKMRIEKACHLLLQTDAKINMEELAFLCGFNSRASFYRNFQQEIGCSPSAYRERF